MPCVILNHQAWQQRTKLLLKTPADMLLIHEIYASVQGESTYAGVSCVFIRTTACHLRCHYCDTPQAFGHGKPMSLPAIHAAVAAFGLKLVEITGGEPLLQPGILPLMQQLCDAGYRVLLETSGSLDIAVVDPRVIKIVDMKTPSSGEEPANMYSNLHVLMPHDEVKFVVGNRADYEWAKNIAHTYNLYDRVVVLFGVVFDALSPKDLAAWLVADKLQARMQLQMHKYIWHPEAVGV